MSTAWEENNQEPADWSAEIPELSAWKAEENKPIKSKDVVRFVEEIGYAIRPVVKFTVDINLTDFTVKTREDLKIQKVINEGVRAFVEDTKEWFIYSFSRNLWMTFKNQNDHFDKK